MEIRRRDGNSPTLLTAASTSSSSALAAVDMSKTRGGEELSLCRFGKMRTDYPQKVNIDLYCTREIFELNVKFSGNLRICKKTKKNENH